MLISNEEYPLENWLHDLADYMKIVEGIKKREAMVRIFDNATEMLGYYQIGFTPKQALDRFWKE